MYLLPAAVSQTLLERDGTNAPLESIGPDLAVLAVLQYPYTNGSSQLHGLNLTAPARTMSTSVPAALAAYLNKRINRSCGPGVPEFQIAGRNPVI